MSTFMRYLRDPYNQVFKITANEDSVFRISINGQIFYTIAQLNTYMDSINSNYFPNSADQLYKYFCFIVANSGSGSYLSYNAQMNENVLHYFNSYCSDICYLIPASSLRLLYKYYGNACRGLTYTDHGSSYIDGVAYFDVMMGELNYKARYSHATVDECIADKYLHLEPTYKFYVLGSNDNYVHDTTQILKGTFLLQEIIDDLYMRMPANSYIILPIKTTSTTLTANSVAINPRGNAVATFPSGVIGDVEMPFTLTHITGTGVVTVDSITYNLPADEAALAVVLQTYASYYNEFTITSNTGGIEAEYLVSHRLQLFNKNNIDLTITSGDVSISRVSTNLPMDVTTVSVNKKGASSFTLDFINIFTNNKSFVVPRSWLLTWDKKFVFFANNSSSCYMHQLLYNYNEGSHYNIDCGDEVIDKCFASKLMPRSDSFTDSIELTFVPIDSSTTYYTTNGVDPTSASTPYTVPFTISATTTVKWINCRTGYADSHINSRTITKS